MSFFKSIFGAKSQPAPEPVVIAAVASPRPPRPASTVFAAPEFTPCTDRRYFEILETYQHRSRPLHEYVSWDIEEEKRLKMLRIEAYQLRNGTDYQPHDVFHLWPYQPVDPGHVIRHVTLKAGAPKVLPEYSQILQVNVVSDRVMKAITALEEAGRQAFYPLDIVPADGGTRQRYHFMQFLEHTDCTVPKLGGFRKGVRQDGTTYWVRTSSDDKVYLDADHTGTRHLFFDKRAKSGCFISSELAAKLGEFLPAGLYLAETGTVRPRG
jgi:hypothetical protein